MFCSKTDKQLLEIRNQIFLENGVPFLNENNFKKSPFSTAWYGKNNLGDYTYEFCKLLKKSDLVIITTHISKGDKWIKIILNVFNIEPNPKSLKDLQNNDGLQFSLPPNSLTEMRLRVDDFEGMPLLNFKNHKLKNYNTERGFNNRIKELSTLIKEDMINIDSFIDKWYKKHTPILVDWEGKSFSQ